MDPSNISVPCAITLGYLAQKRWWNWLQHKYYMKLAKATENMVLKLIFAISKYNQFLTAFLVPTSQGDCKNMQGILFPQWLFEGRPRPGEKCCPIGWIGCPILQVAQTPPWDFNFLHIFAIPSSIRHEKCCKMAIRFIIFVQLNESYKLKTVGLFNKKLPSVNGL